MGTNPESASISTLLANITCSKWQDEGGAGCWGGSKGTQEAHTSFLSRSYHAQTDRQYLPGLVLRKTRIAIHPGDKRKVARPGNCHALRLVRNEK